MSLRRGYLFDVINDIEAKKELKEYLTELYEQAREYNKIFEDNLDKPNNQMVITDGILSKQNQVILKHISYNIKKVNLINEGRWIYSNFDNETKKILKLIYSSNFTWEGVQLELGISKSTISRKRALAEEEIVKHYLKEGLIEKEEELDFYFGHAPIDIKVDISSANKELKKFLDKMNDKYNNDEDAMVYYKQDINNKNVHIMEDEQYKENTSSKNKDNQ